ncbi:MAG: MFS transporter [Acidimicrobiales bacterium]
MLPIDHGRYVPEPPLPPPRPAFDLAVCVLGAVTIAAYGSTYYAFGVIVDPIHADTGWTLTTLGSAYALSLVLGGLGATVAGPVVDRWGGRRVLVTAATVGAGLLGSAALAPTAVWFVVTWGAGAGTIGALAFYHVTIVVMVRARGGSDPRAYAALTFLGGLSSPLYLPLTALAIGHYGWRTTQALLALTLALILAIAAVVVPGDAAAPTDDDGDGDHDGSPPDGSAGTDTAVGAVRRALGDPLVVVFVVAVALASVVGTALHAYQIPAMHAAGLTLAAASTLAAVRGLCSLPGRAALAVVVSRISAPAALLAAYLTMTVGTVLLLGAGVGLAPAYAVVTGIAYRSLLPLQALVAADVFPAERLGTLMGAQQGLNSLVAATAPVAAGLVIDRTGSFTIVLVVVAGGFAVSAALMSRLTGVGARTTPGPPGRSGTTAAPLPPSAPSSAARRPRRWVRSSRPSPAAPSSAPASDPN